MGELVRVWNGAALSGYPFGQFVRMLILTAQRRTEVATMRWADLDLKAGNWTLPAGQTKADRAQLVPLSPMALEILDNIPELGPYVFTTDGQTHIANFAKSKARLDEFLAVKGGVLAPWRLHDLRRTAATNMVRLGVSMEITGRVLNHSVVGITATTYGLHDYAAEKRHALDLWAAEVDRAVNGERGGNVIRMEKA